MEGVLQVDWQKVLVPQTPLLEIFLRGTITYLFVFTIFRLIFKRQTGTWSITDLIVVVFVADASQNAMAGEYTAVADGMILVTVISFWAFTLDWASYHSRTIERLIKPPPLPLVKDGKMVARNMKKELLTPHELMSHLHLAGVENLEDVELAQMESNGQISVIRKSEGETNHPDRIVP